MIPVIIIEGATATGKTALAIELARRFDTEIISADSRQVYKYLDIGTAKPSKEELSKVRHHLIGIIEPDASYNTGLFNKQAGKIIRSLHKLGKYAIVCGGTGLYVKALLDGLFREDINDNEVRADLANRLQTSGLTVLYSELQMVDPVAADKIEPNDRQRILRALEVWQVSGMPLSEHWQRQERKKEFMPFRILLEDERQVLYERINKRILEMVRIGLLDEIENVLSKGFTWSDPGFNSVGYKELRLYFEHSSDLPDCLALAQQHTRNYAKRQVTWYRKCNFHLTTSLTSINFNSVEGLIRSYFD